MGFFSTAVSSIGSALEQVGGFVGDFLGSDIAAPFVRSGLELGTQELVRTVRRQPTTGLRPGGATAMPGGAPIMPTMPTSPLALPALFSGGGNGGVAAPGTGTPRILQRMNPRNPNLVDTWVKAPRVRYKVSVSGPRRCRKR